MPGSWGAARWTAAAWRSSRRHCPLSCSPGAAPTANACCATSRLWPRTTPPRSPPSGRAADVRHAIATVCVSGSLESKLAAAAGAGFDGIELFEPDLAESGLTPTQVRDLATELGLTIDLFQPLAAEQLHALADDAAAHGVRIAYE